MATQDGAESEIRKILVVGATEFATSILSELMDAAEDDSSTEQFSLTTVTYPGQDPPLPAGRQSSSRQDSHSSSLPSCLRHLTSDFSSESLVPIFQSQDLIVNTLPPTSLDLHKTILDAAISASCPRYIPSEFSHDSMNPILQEGLPPIGLRAAIIEQLQAHAAKQRIEWLGLATGVMIRQALARPEKQRAVQFRTATMFETPRMQMPFSSNERLGDAVLAAARRWPAVRNEYLYVHGCVSCVDDHWPILETALGTKREDWAIDYVDPKEWRREGEGRIAKAVSEGDKAAEKAAREYLWRGILCDPDSCAFDAFIEDGGRDAKRLGLEPENVRDMLLDGLMAMKKRLGVEEGACGCT